MANGLPVVVVFIVLTTLFTYVKGAIPLIAPFSWDPGFTAWDRWPHFGTDPWKLLVPFLNYAPVTVAVTGVYHMWFIVMRVVFAACAFAKTPTALRIRFLLAFMLAWIVGGNLLAIVFSSAGPVTMDSWAIRRTRLLR
jgi:hypothetical protein